MRLIVSGSRKITDRIFVEKTIIEEIHKIQKSGKIVKEIVHGDCWKGVDAIVSSFMKTHYDGIIEEVKFLADWEKNGKAAGPIRNMEMAKYGDCLLAFLHPDYPCKGTKNMVRCMRKLGKPLRVLTVSTRI